MALRHRLVLVLLVRESRPLVGHVSDARPMVYHLELGILRGRQPNSMQMEN